MLLYLSFAIDFQSKVCFSFHFVSFLPFLMVFYFVIFRIFFKELIDEVFTCAALKMCII